MSTREQIKAAQWSGVGQRLRGAIWADRNSDRQARHRSEWPELWEALDRVVELVDAETASTTGQKPLFSPPNRISGA